MKKILSVIILLSCIVSSMFAERWLTAEVIETPNNDYKLVGVYEWDDNLQEIVHVLDYTGERDEYGKYYYAVEWYKAGATAMQLKEWIDFAKTFAEVDILYKK